MTRREQVTVKQLSSGWWHIQGPGPCNWCQPPRWPCDEATIREYAFGEASEKFIRAVIALANLTVATERRFGKREGKR